MRKFLLTVSLMMSFVFAKAQSITLTFTANNQYGGYHEFSTVKVENLTQNWQHYMNYPDTVIMLQITDGIGETEKTRDVLSLAGPNPFKGTTQAELQISKSGNVEVKILQIDGKLVARYENNLPQGKYLITFNAAAPQMYLLVATTSQGCYATKLMNTGYGSRNGIELDMLSESTQKNNTKSRNVGAFQLGDEMRYTAFGANIESNAITQHQYGSENIVLQFIVTPSANLPQVTTKDVIYVSTTTATCGGNVTSDGGSNVTALGVCYGTSANPTINDNHTVTGSGTGSFTSVITGLTSNTTYYVRAYATNSVGTAYGEQKTFTTQALKPIVTTSNITSISNTTATCGGSVTSEDGAIVTARGVCYGTSTNPTISGNHTDDGTGTGTFTSNLTGLTPNTTYYVRAYATNSAGTSYGEQKTFSTLNLLTVNTNNVSNISYSSATCGGNVTADGGATVTARGVCYSTSQNPTISDSHTTDGSGVGTFTSNLTGLTANTTYYVRAYAINSGGTSYGEQKTFTTQHAPTGALNAKYSVSGTKKVYFSQGNLQYQASTNTWRFATSQLKYIGSHNANITSSTYSGWIDLFSWGTGNNPITNSECCSCYSSYTEWGSNPISNGGNQAGQWRTLTSDEWSFLMFNRTTTSGIRYAKATVNGVKGVIILPDDWSTSYYTLSSTNSSGAAFTANTITSSNWTSKFEAHGAVFLPAAYCREGTSVDLSTAAGYYWSSSPNGSYNAYYLRFGGGYLGMYDKCRAYGFSVRLVVDE